MTERKTDARVRFTKLMIRNSYVALLKEKGPAKVTVTDICSLAGINRATFYAHYRNPGDLMESLENELLDNILCIMDKSELSNTAELSRILPEIISYVKSEADLCLVLMSDLTDSGFVMRFLLLLEERFVGRWTARGSVPPELANQLFLFSAMGSVGLLRRWLTLGCPQSPEDMAGLIITLFNGGASAVSFPVS